MWISFGIISVAFALWRPRAFLVTVLTLLLVASGLLVLAFITVIVGKLLGGGDKK